MKFPALLYLALSLAVIVNAQAEKSTENLITRDAIIKDLDEYRDGIDKNHIDPYSFIKRKDFFREIDTVKQSADKCDADELLVKLLQVNASLRDGHTSVQIKPGEMAPMIIHWYEEGFFIIATNDENRKYYHSRIVAVNDVPIDEIEKRIATIIPDTNRGYIDLQLPYYLIDPVILHGLHITAGKNSISYTVITTDGNTEKITPALIDVRDKNKITGLKPDKFLRTAVRGIYWFKYIDSNRTVYLNYSRCVDDGTFQHVTDDLEKIITEKAPRKIIIDIRYNSGGNSALFDPVIDYLASSSLNRKGGIYVLIGPKTYSSAVLNAVSLKRRTNAIFVGEETGCNAEHFGDVKSFKLPATQWNVYYSTKHFGADVDYPGPVCPDIKINEKFAEYDMDIDSVVDYAMAQ